MVLSTIGFALVLAPTTLAWDEPPPSLETEPTPEVSAGAIEYQPRWGYDGVYFAMGVAPASTLHIDGFNPGLRYDSEIGMAWSRGRFMVTVGADGKIHQVFGRGKPGGGLDGVVTAIYGPVYARVGAGVAAGIPASIDPEDTRPAMGGFVGVGLQGGRKVKGRIGIDYDVRMDTSLRVNQTVLLTLRFVFGLG